MTSPPVPRTRSSYDADLLGVTQSLLGCVLVRTQGRRRLRARLLEVEAYGGRDDPCAHSHRGRTPRCATMFGPVGHAYVYFTYGHHFCLNVVAGDRSAAGAILLRAAEPLEGVEAMRASRAARTTAPRMRERLERGEADHLLMNGPGNLTAALAVDAALDRHDLTRGRTLWIEPGPAPSKVTWTPRIGLSDMPGQEWRWRVVDAQPATQRLSRKTPGDAAPSPTVAEVRRRRHRHRLWDLRESKDG